jgi:hypothetical protein
VAGDCLMKKYKDGGDITINGIIKSLVTKHEFYKVRELWEEFFNELDRHDLDPKIIPHANPKKTYIEYDFDNEDLRKKKTYKTFGNDVSNFRKKKSK